MFSSLYSSCTLSAARRMAGAALLTAIVCIYGSPGASAESKFGLSPLPLVHGLGTVWVVMDALGERILYSIHGRGEVYPKLHNLEAPSADYLYEIGEHELRVLRRGDSGTVAISGDGRWGFRFFIPSFFLVDGFNFRHEIIDLDAGVSVGFLPSRVGGPCTGCYSAGVTDFPGNRYVFVREGHGVSLWEKGVGVSDVSPLSRPNSEVLQPAMSRDGMVIAFAADSNFDPTTTTGGRQQIFVYDARTGELRQLTGRAGEGFGGDRVRLSADGRRLSHQPTIRAIEVLDTASGEVLHRIEVGEQFEIGDSHLSADGNVVAFMTAADLDPRVGNPRLWSQLFRADLATGDIDQVTQVQGPAGWFHAMDAEAKTFVLLIAGLIEIDGIQLQAGSGSVYRERRPGNRPPTLTAPETVYGGPGLVTRFVVSASDPDGDPLSFYAELESAETTFEGWAWRLGMEIEDILDADGDGQTAISFRPGFQHAGHHRLKVAVFDGAGGAALREVDMHFAYAGPEQLDVNCDHRFDSADMRLVALAVFTPLPRVFERCTVPSTDTNGDGVTNAADIVGLALLYDPPADWPPDA